MSLQRSDPDLSVSNFGKPTACHGKARAAHRLIRSPYALRTFCGRCRPRCATFVGCGGLACANQSTAHFMHTPHAAMRVASPLLLAFIAFGITACTPPSGRDRSNRRSRRNSNEAVCRVLVTAWIPMPRRMAKSSSGVISMFGSIRLDASRTWTKRTPFRKVASIRSSILNFRRSCENHLRRKRAERSMREVTFSEGERIPDMTPSNIGLQWRKAAAKGDLSMICPRIRSSLRKRYYLGWMRVNVRRRHATGPWHHLLRSSRR